MAGQASSPRRTRRHTLGRRAYAAASRRSPTTSKWGDQDWGGYLVAEYVTTSFVEELRAPCFVDATSKLKQNESKMGLFFVEGLGR